MKTRPQTIENPIRKLSIKQFGPNNMLIYRLINCKSPIELCSDGIPKAKERLFSLSIIKLDAQNINEEKYTYEFSCDKKDAVELFDTIVRNTVTPCTLADVIDDFKYEHDIF